VTTNVFDMDSRQVATDSRWSIDCQKFILFIDDTGFDKICLAKRHAFMFAGNGPLIQQWKDWLQANPLGASNMPDVQGIAICIINMPTAEIKFEHGQDIVLTNARFTGTGSKYAHNCWSVHADAKKAVMSATKSDYFSGGTIAFVELATGSTNLANSATYEDLRGQLLERGMMMYKQDASTSQTLQDAAAADPEVARVVEGIAAGTVVASAPYDSMDKLWSQTDIKQLSAVLEEIFG